MSLYALPSLAESKISDYLSGSCTGLHQTITPTGNVSGNFSFVSFFRGDELTYPAVIVKVGKLQEVEPGTHLYHGDLGIAVLTNIDTADNAVVAHDTKVAEVYDAIANTDAFFSGVNGGDTFHVQDYIINSYEQDIDERGYKSLLELQIWCQTRAVS